MPSKGSTTARGYGHKHQQDRKRWAPVVKAGKARCRRCGQPIAPGARWDLGHDDHDRTKPTSPEHVGRECPAGGNRATAGRQQKRRTRPAALAIFD